ncbi:cupredoxin domain-containing protein [Candidatus Solirubrobacter pratensis]|uniref:cupredoxin domain-containing protein n=1 Tax=Candidatus Solirubrobacter pratensis TaxID=1298857 RepID=UPI0006861564|nr:cupredoxin domain-containing protein [Candidatus Solirubrobacter pratensis]
MCRTVAAAAVITLLAAGVAACGSSSDPSKDPAPSSTATSAAKQSSAPTVAGRSVTVDMRDFRFTPSDLTARAGKLTIKATNTGQQVHELVLVRTNAAPDAIPSKGGKASEAGSVGEISERKPGASGTHTFNLTPGRYVFLCNVDGHYAAGMRGSLIVK